MGAEAAHVQAETQGLAETVACGEAVVVTDVSKSFGETRALRSCSFVARAGEVHAVVGENGSGKSTLAKVIAGVIPPDSGTVCVYTGTPKNPVNAHKLGLAMVFQEILVADGASVMDNLYLGHDGMFRPAASPAEKRARAQGLMNRLVGSHVDLSANVDDLPLSTRQWIVIARALLGNPHVVIFDEATAALDHESVQRFFAEVRRLKEANACVLVVTHRIHELSEICDRATVLSDGAAVGTLSGNEITEDRLLKLMSGVHAATEERTAAQQRIEKTACTESPELLTVSGLKLTTRSEPIDLVVHEGEIIGLAGLEGQGQGEFIRTIAGIDAPVEGQVTVRIDGESEQITSEKAAERAGIAYIPGDRKLEGLFFNLSVFENFGVPLYKRANRFGFIERRRIRRMFANQIRDLSIRLGRQDAPINSLSGGNQQKVVIGRSLAATPRVIALNDPTRGVDIATKRDLYQLLKGLAAEGRAVLFLSNEIEEFAGLCDRVAVFRGQSLFSILVGDEITDDAVLAALFGHEQNGSPAARQEHSNAET